MTRRVLRRLRGSSADDDALERRIVWMIGSPRTGTTWLLNLLAQQPGFVEVNEPNIGTHLGVFRVP